MQGQTEIKIGKGKDSVTYGVLFNNLAIVEAESVFGVDLRTFNFMKSKAELIILVYCGIVASCAKWQIKPISWTDFYEKVENDEIGIEEFNKAIKAFDESAIMGKFVKAMNDTLESLKEKAETEKKKKANKKAIASLKKGKSPSIEG
jgi:hypothetical protein